MTFKCGISLLFPFLRIRTYIYMINQGAEAGLFHSCRLCKLIKRRRICSRLQRKTHHQRLCNGFKIAWWAFATNAQHQGQGGQGAQIFCSPKGESFNTWLTKVLKQDIFTPAGSVSWSSGAASAAGCNGKLTTKGWCNGFKIAWWAFATNAQPVLPVAFSSYQRDAKRTPFPKGCSRGQSLHQKR